MRQDITWWREVKVGDKLREVYHDGDRLIHVISVFEDEGRWFAAGKMWWKHKQRWHYEVYHDTQALVGMIYRDGEERPE